MKTQISIFDFKPGSLDNGGIPFVLDTKSPLRTLKREVKRRRIDPKAIEKRLMGKIGTLHLHKLTKIKEYDNSRKYYNYLKKRIYSSFFKSIVETINESNYLAQFKEIEELLSDEEVTVKLGLETGIHRNMTKGTTFIVSLESSERKVFFITGTNETGSSKHRSSRWYPKYGKHSERVVASVNQLLPELLIEKEMRKFYSLPERENEYMKILRKYFDRGDKLYIDERIEKRHPVIKDTLEEEATLRDLKIHSVLESYDTSIYCSLMGYYGTWTPAGLGVLYNEPRQQEINGHHLTSISRSLTLNFLSVIIPKILDAKFHIKSLKKSSGEYAATYQQKKNIPEKTMMQMKKSSLLKFFRDVEYDELVDLSNVEQFESEIISYIEKFNIPVPDNASFKVRRLGKIKAAGVFYPAFNTLAVDVNYPNAFIHEFWHMIDYYAKDNIDDFTGDRLSSRNSFEKVVKHYREIVKSRVDELPSEHPVRTRHYGKTKYNKDYFFENTEIFARCAEMYFSKALEGKSSLVTEKDQIYYPREEILEQLINEYFTNLLKEATHNEEIDAA